MTSWHKQIPIQVRAVAVSVPIWVVQPSIDLKICMFDHLYQDSIVVQSRWVQNKAETLSCGGFECTLDTELWHLNVFMSPAWLPIKTQSLIGRRGSKGTLVNPHNFTVTVSLIEVHPYSMYKPCWALTLFTANSLIMCIGHYSTKSPAVVHLLYSVARYGYIYRRS